MEVKVDFCKEYSDLIPNDLPIHKLTSVDDRGGYLTGDSTPIIPEKYKKPFIHTPNGFAANYCEEY